MEKISTILFLLGIACSAISSVLNDDYNKIGFIGMSIGFEISALILFLTSIAMK